ncbi:MAG: membrane dipeptidase [Rhodocyclales bacterium]|nr:membrane dipeptidase [Rhodocyclales bacterium]
MERRRFLNYCSATGLSAVLSDWSFGRDPETAAAAAGNGTAGLLIADPHAHPYPLRGSRSYDPSTPTIEIMKQLNMALCSFSAVGDMTFMRGHSGMPFADTKNQLRIVKRMEEQGEIRLLLKAADLPALIASHTAPAGLMAVEGGDALEGKLQNLDALHEYGVRLMTLMHERDNEIGFNQRSGSDGPLTPFGASVVEKMNALGMVIDVSHAKGNTLKGIAEVSAMPLVDSHTSPFLPGEEGSGLRRLRTWREMETIAGTGGLVCTWPLAYSGKNSERNTLKQWAEEIVQMKARLGMEHCGLGTDGGGGLPRFVKGWESIASLPDLIGEMRQAGLTQGDIAAYVGGNFLRLLAKCLA